MKDTQGIVSSEAVWYSRHDGYILDSRGSAWKHQRHKTFKKPSKIFRTPEMTSIDRAVGMDCLEQTAIWGRHKDFQSFEKRG
jgi:hypothetical protein